LVIEGGSLRELMVLPAAVVVFGGTYGATIACCGMKSFLRSPLDLMRALLGKTSSRKGLVEEMVEIATRARREGLLALESQVAKLSHPVLRKALQLVVDGLDPEMVAEIMYTDLAVREVEERRGAQYYLTWAGLGPTLGVTGTVMGLINMMGKLDDPSAMGPAIASAFCATLYGVATANLIFIPIGKKLMAMAEDEKAAGEMIIEGVRSIQEGASPLTVRQRLSAYLGEANAPKAGGEVGGEELRKAA